MRYTEKISDEERRNMGERLRSLRRNRDLSQRELEKSIEVNVSSIYMYEHGKNIPRTEVALKYQVFFGRPLSDIFGERIAERFEEVQGGRYYQKQRAPQEVPEHCRHMREDRKKAGVSLESMAQKIRAEWPHLVKKDLNCTKIYLSKVERGLSRTTHSTELTLAYALILGTDAERYKEK